MGKYLQKQVPEKKKSFIKGLLCMHTTEASHILNFKAILLLLSLQIKSNIQVLSDVL